MGLRSTASDGAGKQSGWKEIKEKSGRKAKEKRKDSRVGAEGFPKTVIKHFNCLGFRNREPPNPLPADRAFEKHAPRVALAAQTMVSAPTR
jgi:hypothetical protein